MYGGVTTLTQRRTHKDTMHYENSIAVEKKQFNHQSQEQAQRFIKV